MNGKHRVVNNRWRLRRVIRRPGKRACATREVTLVDRRNFHLFQPLLYQVATGALSPANIASPLRAILKRQLRRNTRVLLAEVPRALISIGLRRAAERRRGALRFPPRRRRVA